MFYPSELVCFFAKGKFASKAVSLGYFPQPCAAKILIRLFLKESTTSVFSSPLAGMHLHLTHPKCQQLERAGLSLELHLRPEDICH